MNDSTPIMVLEYTTTKELAEAQHRLLYGDVKGRIVAITREAAVLRFVPVLLGSYAAWKAEMMGAVILIAVCGIGIARELWSGYKKSVGRMTAAAEQYAGTFLRIEVSERGFTEHDQGVESFCPWRTMKNFCLRDEALFVELANGTWAMIPAANLKPEGVTLAQVEAILVEHGVARRA